MATRLYPIGIQTFSEIRAKDMFYADKTEYVYRMTHGSSKYVFLSRPRRFGKSLFVSTLKSYFEGRKELFKGLAIDKMEKDWTTYPVLHFSMAGGKHMEKEDLERYLGYRLAEEEARFGIDHPANGTNNRLFELIQTAYRQTGRQVVVLIDEYDAPLLDVVHEYEQLPVLRNVMRNFYSPLKDCDPYLRFVFLTGITKFSQMSIFSELNNITNISMEEDYAGICGITREEMLSEMGDDLERLAQSLKLTREETVTALTEYYDGYHFCWPSPDVFNPYSLLNSFSSKKLKAYWFSSGTPTYLIEMMRKFGVKPADLQETRATLADFDAPTETMETIVPLLYQSGYVTIKDYDSERDVYTLSIPNKEIGLGLYGSLIPYYMGQASARGRVTAADLSALINRGDMDGGLQLLQEFLETLPYTDNTLYEGHYQQMLYLVFALLTNYRIAVEQHTKKGRTDMTIETQSRIYIVEIKFGKPAAEALEQIKQNQYAKAFVRSGKPVTLVGIGFNVEEQRNITDWVIAD